MREPNDEWKMKTATISGCSMWQRVGALTYWTNYTTISINLVADRWVSVTNAFVVCRVHTTKTTIDGISYTKMTTSINDFIAKLFPDKYREYLTACSSYNFVFFFFSISTIHSTNGEEIFGSMYGIHTTQTMGRSVRRLICAQRDLFARFSLRLHEFIRERFDSLWANLRFCLAPLKFVLANRKINKLKILCVQITGYGMAWTMRYDSIGMYIMRAYENIKTVVHSSSPYIKHGTDSNYFTVSVGKLIITV